MTKNKNLNDAGKAKKDEFYTLLSTVESEMIHYRHHFKDKVVFCNCDDPEWSNFWKYFELNFNVLGLKKLIATHYEADKQSYMLEISRDENLDGIFDFRDIRKTVLKGNGDFRSDECVELLKEADICCTNPPFSLFPEFFLLLNELKKDFIIIGNQNVLTNKNIFPYIRDNKVWLGASIHSGDREFMVPDDYPLNAAGFRVDENGKKYIRIKGVRWFTNLDYKTRHEDLILYKTYNPVDYLKYDNYEAINVDVTKDIPIDYDGVMGVPITFMDKYNPDQFEIVGLIAGNIKGLAGIPSSVGKDGPYIDGKLRYGRILIRRK